MQDAISFEPDRRMGLIFHIISIILLALLALGGQWQAARANISPMSIFNMLPVLAAAIIGPILAYRIYALRSAVYTLERDGIHLRWGLRSEDIPMNQVLWVHPAANLSAPLPLPRLRFPGAVVGKRSIPGDGEIEFLASDARRLLLIATERGGFAISPADPERFLQAYQRFTEMGSFTSLTPRSVYPAFLLKTVWSSPFARALLLICFTLNLALLAWVGFAMPGREAFHLGFRPDGSPGDLMPAARLYLLPLLNAFFLLMGVLAGLFFFRRDESRPVSYLLWSVNAFTSLLFLFAVLFILRAG